MENQSPYPRDTPVEQAYPDPNAEPTPITTPFYSHNPQNEQSSAHTRKAVEDAAAEIMRQQLASVNGALSHTNDNQPYPPHDQTANDIDGALRDDDGMQHGSPDRMAGSVPLSDEQQQQMYAQNVQDSAQRKRTKVSRACDECRRKKIRCDVTDIDGVPCSSCKRSGMMCAFSRQPMKRGPSKGYIKELADRLNSLESQLNAPQGQQQPPQQQQGLPPSTQDFQMYADLEQLRDGSPPNSNPRKRTHSVSEQGNYNMPPQNGSYAPARQPSNAWSPDTSRQLPPPAAMMSGPGVPPSTQPIADFFPPRQPQPAQHAHERRFDGGQEYRPETQMHPPEKEMPQAEPPTTLDWDESVIDEYYRICHSTFPLLPHSKARLRARLLQCPPTLRLAFLASIDAFVRSSPSTLLPPSPDVRQSTRKAAELIANSLYDNPSARTPSAYIVYMQALILMALESDNHGPATMRGQVGPPRAEWLGRAIGMATHLKLNIPRSRDRYNDDDRDSDDKLGRRVWWILFILDRWHASSTSCLVQLPDSSSSLLPEDAILLGESTYHLARLSFILGHVCQIMQQPASLMSQTSAAGPIISTTILGEIDRFRESVESLLLAAPNLVHLCYWHVRLLVLRLTSSTTPHELLGPAARMTSILNSSHTMITPLNHHFAALAAMTLAELNDFEETRPKAQDGIQDLVEALAGHRGLMGKEGSTGWDGAIRELVTKHGRTGDASISANGERDRGLGAGLVGLQHLADAAATGKRPPPQQQQQQMSSHAGQDVYLGPGFAALQDGSVGGSGTPSTTAQAPYDPTVVIRYGYLAALVNNEESASGAGAR